MKHKIGISIILIFIILTSLLINFSINFIANFYIDNFPEKICIKNIDTNYYKQHSIGNAGIHAYILDNKKQMSNKDYIYYYSIFIIFALYLTITLNNILILNYFLHQYKKN